MYSCITACAYCSRQEPYVCPLPDSDQRGCICKYDMNIHTPKSKCVPIHVHRRGWQFVVCTLRVCPVVKSSNPIVSFHASFECCSRMLFVTCINFRAVIDFFFEDMQAPTSI